MEIVRHSKKGSKCSTLYMWSKVVTFSILGDFRHNIIEPLILFVDPVQLILLIEFKGVMFGNLKIQVQRGCKII